MNVSTQCLRCLSKISILFSDFIVSDLNTNSNTNTNSSTNQNINNPSNQEKNVKPIYISFMNFFYVQRDNSHDFVLRQSLLNKIKKSIVLQVLYGEELLTNELIEFFAVCVETQSGFINILMEDLVKEEHWKKMFSLTETNSLVLMGNMLLLIGNIFKHKTQYKKIINQILSKYNKDLENFLKKAIDRFSLDQKEM